MRNQNKENRCLGVIVFVHFCLGWGHNVNSIQFKENTKMWQITAMPLLTSANIPATAILSIKKPKSTFVTLWFTIWGPYLQWQNIWGSPGVRAYQWPRDAKKYCLFLIKLKGKKMHEMLHYESSPPTRFAKSNWMLKTVWYERHLVHSRNEHKQCHAK